MINNLTPDPREEKLPVWVKESMASMRRTIRTLEETVAAVKGEHPGSNVRLFDKGTRHDIALPKNAHVSFDSNWGKVIVGHDLDGRVRIQGDSRLILRMNAANALTVELPDD